MPVLQTPQDVLFLYTLHSCDRPQNCIQGTDAKRCMIGNGDSMLPGLVRFENDVATFLIHPPIAEMFTEKLDQILPAQITRKLHAASTSSRT